MVVGHQFVSPNVASNFAEKAGKLCKSGDDVSTSGAN
jgi:hypothetical protein